MKLRKSEWDFADVPDKELAACRLYEYARESERIRRVLEPLKPADARCMLDVFAGGKHDGYYTLEEWDSGNWMERCESVFRFAGHGDGLIESGRIHTARALVEVGSIAGFPCTPWTALKPEDQRGLMDEMVRFQAAGKAGVGDEREVSVDTRLAVMSGRRGAPLETATLWSLKRDVAWCREHGIDFDNITHEDYGARVDGLPQTVPLCIRFEDYTNAELVAVFKLWLEDYRRHHPDMPEPPKRGRGQSVKDVRQGLGWLGVMRLRSTYQLNRMPKSARDWLCEVHGVDPTQPANEKLSGLIYEDHANAVRLYFKLFPFLDEQADPPVHHNVATA